MWEVRGGDGILHEFGVRIQWDGSRGLPRVGNTTTLSLDRLQADPRDRTLPGWREAGKGKAGPEGSRALQPPHWRVKGPTQGINSLKRCTF